MTEQEYIDKAATDVLLRSIEKAKLLDNLMKSYEKFIEEKSFLPHHECVDNFIHKVYEINNKYKELK